MLRDATDSEFINLVHCRRLERGKLRNFGPYTRQQAICLHFATCCDIRESRMAELGEIAKLEDSLSWTRCEFQSAQSLSPSSVRSINVPSIGGRAPLPDTSTSSRGSNDSRGEMIR